MFPRYHKHIFLALFYDVQIFNHPKYVYIYIYIISFLLQEYISDRVEREAIVKTCLPICQRQIDEARHHHRSRDKKLLKSKNRKPKYVSIATG